MKRFYSALFALFFATLSLAGNDPSNSFKLGDGLPSNKKIYFNRGGATATLPNFRWNEATGTIQFSNDGTNFLDIGSGGGGGSAGFNTLMNQDFENGINLAWTSSGGTYASATSGANLLFGKVSATFVPSGSGQYVESDPYVIPQGLTGQSCLARIYYKGGSANYVLRVLDGSNNTIVSKTFDGAATNTQQLTQNFICPSSGSFKLRVESLAATSLISLDRMYLGDADNLTQLSQAQFFGEAAWPNASACTWSATQSVYADFGSNSNCTFPSGSNLRGNAIAPATKVPAIRFASLPPGDYLFIARGGFYKPTNAGAYTSYRFHDGTNGSEDQTTFLNGTSSDTLTPLIMGRFTYTTTQSNITFNIQGQSTVGDALIEAGQTGSSGLTITVYKFPTTQQTALRVDQVGWRVQATMKTSDNSNVELQTATNPYAPASNSNLVMTKQPGSLDVQIPCSGTNPSTGLTCAAGSEQVGVVFNLPAPGTVMACISHAHNMVTGSGGAVDTRFKWYETPNASDSTTIQTGADILSSGNSIPTTNLIHPLRHCDILTFTSSGQKTLRYENALTTSGTITNNLILTDDADGRNIQIEVYPVQQFIGQPLIVNSVATPSLGVEHLARVATNSGGNCTSSPCTIESQSGTWVSSITRSTTGTYVLNVPLGIFSAKPSCTCSAVVIGTGPRACSIEPTSSATAITVYSHNGAGSGVDSSFNVNCLGAY